MCHHLVFPHLYLLNLLPHFLEYFPLNTDLGVRVG